MSDKVVWPRSHTTGTFVWAFPPANWDKKTRTASDKVVWPRTIHNGHTYGHTLIKYGHTNGHTLIILERVFPQVSPAIINLIKVWPLVWPLVWPGHGARSSGCGHSDSPKGGRWPRLDYDMINTGESQRREGRKSRPRLHRGIHRLVSGLPPAGLRRPGAHGLHGTRGHIHRIPPRLLDGPVVRNIAAHGPRSRRSRSRTPAEPHPGRPRGTRQRASRAFRSR